MQQLIDEDSGLKEKVIGLTPRNILGGVIVEDRVGENRIDNTFETRLQMLLPRILPEIGKELF
jgi:vacuolar-type H+-ATPase subunit E/Vma4